MTQRDLVQGSIIRLHWLYEAHLRLELALHLLWKYWCCGLNLRTLATELAERRIDYLSLDGVPHRRSGWWHDAQAQVSDALGRGLLALLHRPDSGV